MTYTELIDQLPHTLAIQSLGGRTSLTIYTSQSGLMVENSKGSTYRLSREDWINAQRIRAAYPQSPWKTSLYTGLSELFSYSLVYAAALLRHIEPEEVNPATLILFRSNPQEQSAA